MLPGKRELALRCASRPEPGGNVDHGHAEWVLILAAGILVASILCMGTARASAKNDSAVEPVAAE